MDNSGTSLFEDKENNNFNHCVKFHSSCCCQKFGSNFVLSNSDELLCQNVINSVYWHFSNSVSYKLVLTSWLIGLYKNPSSRFSVWKPRPRPFLRSKCWLHNMILYTYWLETWMEPFMVKGKILDGLTVQSGPNI